MTPQGRPDFVALGPKPLCCFSAVLKRDRMLIENSTVMLPSAASRRHPVLGDTSGCPLCKRTLSAHSSAARSKLSAHLSSSTDTKDKGKFKPEVVKFEGTGESVGQASCGVWFKSGVCFARVRRGHQCEAGRRRGALVCCRALCWASKIHKTNCLGKRTTRQLCIFSLRSRVHSFPCISLA